MSTQTSIDRDELFIGGAWVKPRGSARISVTAASTEEPVGSVPEGTNADIDAAVSAARAAFDDPSGWASWSAEDRAQALERLAGGLESRGEEIAQLVSLQNGMPISFALQAEAVYPALLARYYAGLIRQISPPSLPTYRETPRTMHLENRRARTERSRACSSQTPAALPAAAELSPSESSAERPPHRRLTHRRRIPS